MYFPPRAAQWKRRGRAAGGKQPGHESGRCLAMFLAVCSFFAIGITTCDHLVLRGISEILNTVTIDNINKCIDI